MEDTKNLKMNLYRLKMVILENKYNLLINYKNDIIIFMNKYINILKLIDNIYRNADIKSYKYEKTKYPDTLYKNELINRYKFYAILIGYIDSNLDVKKSCGIKEYTYFKNLVLQHCFNNMRLTDPNIFFETLKGNIEYESFKDIFIDKKNTDNHLLLDLLESYIIGYKNNFYPLEIVYNEFVELSYKLDIHKNNNKKKFESLKKIIKN
ncbi:MAG: hypothetical protein IJD92_05460 [Bacilli bacterium]|nr:hypothetical protein [Bacilli bacterium]